MSTAITLDELIALGDEIGALVRAGVPLEQGLAELGSDLPGRMGRFATMLAQRSSRGEPLDQILAEQTEQLPAAYRAVVLAGLRAGRLPAALETVAAAARRIGQSQRAIVLAASYPLLVFVIAWGALAFLSATLVPQLAFRFSAFNVPGSRFLHFIAWLGQGAIWWGPLGPLAVLLVLGAWWYAVTRARSLYAGCAHRLLLWIPWVGPMLRWSQTATFLEILAMLVENQVPLPEGVVLAAGAMGDAELRALGGGNGRRALPGCHCWLAQQCFAWSWFDTAGQASSGTRRYRRRRLSAAGTVVDAGSRTRRRASAGAALLGRSLSPPCPTASRGRPGVLAGGADPLHRRRRYPGLCALRLRAVRRLSTFLRKTLTSHG